MKKKFNFNYKPKTQPFPHQIEAIRYIEENNIVALFDEQGLGKTKIVIEALCNNMNNDQLDSVFVVCKKNLIQTWQEEIETHSFLKPIVLRGTEKSLGNQYMTFAKFYVINYDLIDKESDRLKMFLQLRRFAIVLDESHIIKNPTSKVAISLHYLSKFTIKRIIISGTPVANKPIDIWSQFYFLDNGKLLGNCFNDFKKRYFIDLKDGSSLINSIELEELRTIISLNSIRRKKTDVLELPNKTYIEKYVDLNPVQRSMYNKVRDELVIEIQNAEGEIILDESNDLLKKILRLAQICSNPLLIDKSYIEVPAKFPILETLVCEIISRGEKVIIWSSFVENIKILNKLFRKYNSVMIYGGVPIDKRNEFIKRFKNDIDCKILVANPAAAREGLTLTVANNAIYLDRNFNLVDYLQSQDRIHRISQTKPCLIYKIIALNSLDIFVDEILTRKQYVAEVVQGDKKATEFNYNLSKEDILNYLKES